MINKTILHYKIIERLGEGGMGVVYLAQDTKLEREVAIKFLPSNITSNSDERERFKIEAKAAAALNHPNITTIHAIEEFNDEMFIVMEYIDGKELKEEIASNPLPLTRVLDITTQIAEGLKAAHDKGIIHRDIKSANIMVTDAGDVKIMDFGLAKIGSGIQLTKEHSTLGTIPYMSPEQAKGEDVDHRTDIWSFGVVLYEILTGEMPFKGDYEQAVIYSILNEEPEPVTKLNPEISPELEEVVNRTLAKNPDDRFKNADKLLIDLKSIEGTTKDIDSKTATSQNQKPKQKVAYFYALIAVIIVMISIAGIIFFSDKDQGTKLRSIAVLPFSNSKPDPETDYLGFALADQIIGDLTYLKNLIVRPSSSIRKYEKQIIDPKIAADDLNVDFILTGNYLNEGSIIRLNVELVKTNTNEMIWREPIEVDFRNVFELQDIVAQKIVEGLNVQFSQKELSRIGKDIPSNPLAYEYFLRGVAYPLTIEGNQLAIQMLNQSIELDPNYAPTYAELSERIHELALYSKFDPKKYEKAEKLVLKAISLNDELISAHASLAQIYTETARINRAVEISRKILEINPNNANAHFSLGYIYRYAGMNNEAILEMEKALLIDPGNPRFRSLSISYFNIGEYEKAFNVFEKIKGSD